MIALHTSFNCSLSVTVAALLPRHNGDSCDMMRWWMGGVLEGFGPVPKVSQVRYTSLSLNSVRALKETVTCI